MSQATLSTAPYRNSNLFSGYYLEERVDDLDEWDCDEAAREAFEDLRELWDGEGSLVGGYNEDTLLGSWIDPVLETLGYDTIQETSLPETGGFIDRVLYASATDRRDAMMLKEDGQIGGTFGRAAALLEAKQWGTDFSERFSEQRSYRDASHQVKYYLEQTPENLQWGILTDGRKWRLYGTKDYATETYYEIDLPEILESGDLESFKYFYLFFRPEAFREVGGSTFLDTVWNESETAAQELGEDLQDNVFTALRILGEGFVETNDLDIDPADDDRLEELKEQSLVLLYRLMFVLYAESRHLINPDDPASQTEFRENFSLDEIRLDIHEKIQGGDAFDDYSEHAHSIWSQLQDLFRLVDSGEADLGIPPYNGGLFDYDQHEFLADHEVSNRHIAEVIYRLGTTEADDGSFVLADYADLDTRHLGTIYEGLLEHEFRIAPEEYAAVSEDSGEVWKPTTEVTVADAVETVEAGDLYVVNDDGERKATGAYYTPDYVVSYIVEETVDPLLSDVDADLTDRGLERGTQEYVFRFADEVLDLKVLDPAMGSGHFLTKATGYLTEQVMERVREVEEAAGVLSEQDVRRRVSRECIYGVDLNGMAVELAKLSMWLETLAANQPLAFLDHHLKAGNSLVGSDITEVLSADSEPGTEQATLFDDFSQTRQRTLEHVMELMEDLLAIDNETLADIKSMEEIYAEIRADPLYQRLFELANVHTAERFDVEVPGKAYDEMAGAIEDEAEWADVQKQDWFRAAQATAAEENFFHWELEYPEVFFGSGGETREDSGFDGVVGNPPYVFISSIPESHREYYRETSSTWDYRYDLYGLFTELGHELLHKEANFGYIIPHGLLNNNSFGDLREFLLTSCSKIDVYDFDEPVFEDASNETMILLTQKSESSETVLRGTLTNETGLPTAKSELNQFSAESIQNLPGSPFLVRGGDWIDKVLTDRATEPMGEHIDAVQGLRTGDNKSRLSDQKESDKHKKALGGENIHRYGYDWDDTYVLYDRELLSQDTAARPREPKFWEANQKILVQEIRNVHLKERIVACIDRGGHIGLNTTNALIERSESPLGLSYLMGVLSSRLANEFFRSCFVDNHIATQYIEGIPVPHPDRITTSDEERLEKVLEVVSARKNFDIWIETDNLHQDTIQGLVSELVETQVDNIAKRNGLNLNLNDYLGGFEEGPALTDIGFTQPPEYAAQSILRETTEQKSGLRAGEATVNRESDTTVEVNLIARYKPDDDSLETDQWGYTETDPLPALRITDLTEAEADLIEVFVPVAVDEAGGFANFRETATKTNSLVDRLRTLSLPKLSDVEDGLESYIETKERADELEEKIQRTDDLIDEIVYELYGLTEEEIAIVEESVGN